MAIERERKFLVNAELLPDRFAKLEGKRLEAGYFTNGPVAIRVTNRLDGKSKVCFKSPGTQERQEFEYHIPKEDALALLALSPTHLKKVRFDFEGWEIDYFDLRYGKDSKKSFWMAEWEEHEGKDSIPDPLPKWITKEVTENPLYSNMSLAWRYGRKE